MERTAPERFGLTGGDLGRRAIVQRPARGCSSCCVSRLACLDSNSGRFCGRWLLHWPTGLVVRCASRTTSVGLVICIAAHDAHLARRW